MQRAGFRVVGFDCAEEEHVAVLLDEAGEIEQRCGWRIGGPDRGVSGEVDTGTQRGRAPVIVVESKRAHGRLVVEEAGRLGCQVMQVNTR
jgi:hypothetical protein